MKLVKLISYLFVFFISLWLLQIWYNAFVPGRFWENNPLYLTLPFVLSPLIIVYLTYLAVKYIKKISLVVIFASLMILESCSYAKQNQLVVYSDDCGSTWQQVAPGSRVPTGTGNPCFIKETMPGYTMQGTLEFYVLFKDQVKVKMYCTYDYEIFDPLLFMKEAKTLGKANADADESQDYNTRFEGAENRVIDVKLKKTISDQIDTEDVVSHDINALEEKYTVLINEVLKVRGVRLITLELVPDFQPQTQLAIDAANADRIYDAKGMKEFGRQVTLARAGATQITVTNQLQKQGENTQEEK